MSRIVTLVDASKGERVCDTAEDAVYLAVDLGEVVVMRHSDTQVDVHPGDTVRTVYRRWHEQREEMQRELGIL